MIRSLIAHVRGWSFLVKFVMFMTIVFFVTDLFFGRGFARAFENVLFGVTVIVGSEYLAPAVVGALFTYLHNRKGVPAPCGNPVPPTTADWHHVIISLAAAYAFVAASLAVVGDTFSVAPVLWSAVVFMAPWTGLVLLVDMIAEAVHFLGHYRAHRRELIARERALEQACRDREALATDQAFWEMMRGHKPDSGSVA